MNGKSKAFVIFSKALISISFYYVLSKIISFASPNGFRRVTFN